MKKKQRKRQIKRLRKLQTKWTRPLGLLWWKIDIYYNSNRSDFQRARGFEEIAMTTTSWQYLSARIEWNLELVGHQTDEHLEEVLLHELAHILVCEMREKDKNRKHEERTCEQLSKAFKWLGEGKFGG